MADDIPPELKVDLFDQLLQTTPHDLVWVFSAEWDELVFLSDGYEELWGRSRDTLEDNPQDFLNGIHPDDRDAVTDAMERVSAGEPIDIEYRVIPDEKSHRWIGAYGEPIRDDTGEIVRVAGFVRDITSRKEHERELEQYNTIIETVPDGVYVLDVDFRFTFVNDAFVKMTGYEREELLGSHASLIFDEEALEQGKRIREGLKTGDRQFGTLETEVKTASNGRVPCEIRGQLLGEPEGPEWWGTAGSIRDITEHKEREKERRRVVRRFEAVFENPLTLIGLLQPDGTLVDANPTAIELLNVPLEEVTGEPFWETPWWDHSESVQESLQEWIDRAADGEYVRFEAENATADGETVTVDGLIHPVRDDEGTIRELLAIGRDITKREDYRRELERKNEQLEEFAGIVSHDLRNPLNVAQGRLALAREERDSPHLEAVARTHDRMETLIDDLLTLARQREAILETEPIGLVTTAEQCWQNVETATATLVTDTERTVRADPSQLQQLFENLIRNAIEYAGEDVTVTIGDIDCGFYVADDGPGIPEDDRDQVFEAGYTISEGGTGFGLSIVEGVADAHEWEVSVTESNTGGARFEITGVELVNT